MPAAPQHFADASRTGGTPVAQAVRGARLRRGFTLLEVLVTVALIGLLAGVAVAGSVALLREKPATAEEVLRRAILEALPEWFGIPEAREEYVSESADKLFFAAMDGENPVGFLCLKETGRDTVELYVMGVLKARHRTGAGRALVEAAKRTAREAGYAFMQVKTVQMGKYAEYDATNRFYLAMGFKEFEVFPHLWDEWNPCQVYVMGL